MSDKKRQNLIYAIAPMGTAFRLKYLRLLESKEDLDNLPKGKLLINTINAYSYNVALKDPRFAEALTGATYFCPTARAWCLPAGG